MKKVLAALLALCMVFALFACGGGDSNQPSNQGDSDGSGGNGNSFPVEAGYFDPDFDYTQFKKFKVGYMCAATSFLYEMFDVRSVTGRSV